MKFTFPDPSQLEGVKSLKERLLSQETKDYTYYNIV